ncbi:Pyridoxamine 5'-phosphate oxidase [Paenibacillus sophorae]|uniref:Pyridoxamine 5'-phosphate oxidase n=1 Tax=Paenibacillus sophorae TaxID=1333845 RepID=A0A1H8MNB6_9BACL|nr:pyridoxamine 5'-phosphate oxidase family protein [Paenibacillus sophorae]QWU17882.1 pyridoxamine 5'-phosphate oxidase family protein [Paenibacillus sophorae]SEO18827.1 Pyridoxamine 5'-phosphate oxidase [Paenibacillus sophorae]
MDINREVKNVFDSHGLMRLATIDESGFPKVRPVNFAADQQDESVLYFMSFNSANKVKELQNNNNVHITVDKDANSMEELAQLVFVRGAGKAYQIQTPEELQKGTGLLIDKYPYMKEMPGDPSMMTMFRIELDKVIVTDNRVSFGYIEEHNYR